jgi:hypothetical protein
VQKETSVCVFKNILLNTTTLFSFGSFSIRTGETLTFVQATQGHCQLCHEWYQSLSLHRTYYAIRMVASYRPVTSPSDLTHNQTLEGRQQRWPRMAMISHKRHELLSATKSGSRNNIRRAQQLDISG